MYKLLGFLHFTQFSINAVTSFISASLPMRALGTALCKACLILVKADPAKNLSTY